MGSVSWTTGVQIALVSAPSTFVDFPAATIGDSSDGRATVSVAVDGTKRLFTAAGVPRRFTLSGPAVSRTDFATLQGWVGAKLVVRDPVGRVVYCVLDSVSGDDSPGPDNGVGRVGLSCSEVAGSAEV